MVNKCVMQGRLTKDVEVKQTQGGIPYANFTVAWSEKYKEKEDKCFLTCKAWRGTAEFLGKYFGKGSELIVEGRLITEEWEKDGQKQSRVVLEADKVHFAGKKADNAGGDKGAAFVDVDDASLPF